MDSMCLWRRYAEKNITSGGTADKNVQFEPTHKKKQNKIKKPKNRLLRFKISSLYSSKMSQIHCKS